MNKSLGQQVDSYTQSTLIDALKLYERVHKGTNAQRSERAWSNIVKSLQTLTPASISTQLDLAIERAGVTERSVAMLLCDLAEFVSVDDRLQSIVTNSTDVEVRRWIIDTIQGRKLVKLAPVLNRLMTIEDDLACQCSAIIAAGRLRYEENLSTILSIRMRPEILLAATIALAEYATEQCRTPLREAFCRPVPSVPSVSEIEAVNDRNAILRIQSYEEKVALKLAAARGLVKLQDREALYFLIECLYHPFVRTRKATWHGKALEAAEALNEGLGLSYTWRQDYRKELLEPLRRWWVENEEKVLPKFR